MPTFCVKAFQLGHQSLVFKILMLAVFTKENLFSDV